MGAFHGADLLHIFDSPSLVGAWAAFAATGSPG